MGTSHRKEAPLLFVADCIYRCDAEYLLYINKIYLKNKNTKHKQTFLPVFFFFFLVYTIGTSSPALCIFIDTKIDIQREKYNKTK